MEEKKEDTEQRSKRIRRLLRLLNFYPPFLGAGVRVGEIASDFCTIKVRAKLSWYNRNIAGVHFGGSLYSMCDPFFVLMLMEHLGSDYTVWDKSASIKFKRPGRGTITGVFHIPREKIESIKQEADSVGKAEPVFNVAIVDESGDTIAEVEKVLSVRKKQ